MVLNYREGCEFSFHVSVLGAVRRLHDGTTEPANFLFPGFDAPCRCTIDGWLFFCCRAWKIRLAVKLNAQMSLDPLESFPETRLALWICILRVNSVRYGRQGIRSSSPPPLSCARRGSGQGAGRPGSPSRRKNRLDRPQHGSAPGSFPTCEIFSISPPHGHAFRLVGLNNNPCV